MRKPYFQNPCCWIILLLVALLAASCGSSEIQESGTPEPTRTPRALATSPVITTATPPPAKATETPFLATDTPAPQPTPSLLVTTAVLAGSTGPVYSLDWSPDGQILASAGYGQVNL